MNNMKHINIGEKLSIYSMIKLQHDDVKNAFRGIGFYEILLIGQSLRMS